MAVMKPSIDETVEQLTSQTLAPQVQEPVQVAGVGPAITSMAKGYLKTKPTEEITKGVETRRIPTAEEEVAEDILTTPARQVEMGRPSAYDPEARNINFDYLDTQDDVMQLIDDVSLQQEHFIKERRGTVTHEQTLKEAEQYTIDDLLGRKPSDAFNAAQITSARQILVESGSRIKQASEAILEGQASEADMLAFRQMVAQHSAIQAQVSGMTAEAGRALNAFRIKAEGGQVRASQLKEALRQQGGADAVEKLAKLFADADTPDDIAKVARDIGHATTGDMVIEYWINGLLSSPATHVVNVVSNSMVGLWQVPERLMAAGISKAMRSEDGVKAGEASAQLYGMINGFRDGLRLGGKALIEGEPSDTLMKIEQQQYNAITAENVANTSWGKMIGVNPQSVADGGIAARAVDLLGEGIRIPGRFLGAEDEFFKAIGYRMELNALAYRKAVGEGLKGNDLAVRINQIINDPPEDIHLGAVDASRYQTFTKELGETGQAMQRVANTNPAVKLLVPFLRTPTNIIKYIGERTPLGVMSRNVRAEIAAGGARRDLALSKMAMGSMVMSVGALLAAEGTVTGGGPSESGVRAAMKRQGWQPYSLKVGDTYYAFNRLDPLGMFLGLSADAVEVMKYAETDEEREQVATAVTMAVAKNLTSKTYLSGISDFLHVMDDPDRYLEGYIKRQAASFTPMTSLVANIEREFDPTVRATYSIMDQIKSRTPTLSKELPPRRNLWGEPIVLQGGLGWDFISPIYSSKIEPDVVDMAIVDNEIDVRMPRKYLGQGKFRVELSPIQYDRYVQLAGSEAKEPSTGYGLKEYLEKEVLGHEFYREGTEGPDGSRAMMIKSAVTAFRDLAKAKLIQEFPELEVELEHKQRMKASAMGVEF